MFNHSLTQNKSKLLPNRSYSFLSTLQKSPLSNGFKKVLCFFIFFSLFLVNLHDFSRHHSHFGYLCYSSFYFFPGITLYKGITLIRILRVMMKKLSLFYFSFESRKNVKIIIKIGPYWRSRPRCAWNHHIPTSPSLLSN